MSYNGSGTFNINSTGQPVVTGTVISSSVFNALTADLATGLSTCITKDGQTTVTANIPMNSFKFTNLAAGTAAGDSVRVSQLQAGSATSLTVTGTNTYAATASPALTAYTTGNTFSFVVPNSNTSSCTLNIDSLGAKAITRDGTTALVSGDLVAGSEVLVVYDGTQFQVVNSNSKTNLNLSGTLTVAGNATFSGGTANGVAYLNGSKVLTTGSALTFDGTNLGITGSGARINWSSIGTGGGLFMDYGTGAPDFALTFNASPNVQYDTPTGWPHVWAITSSEQMRLTSTGLGIGTSSPSQKLDVNGQATVAQGAAYGWRITNSGGIRSGSNGVLQVSADTGNAYANSAITFDIDGGTLATLNSSGNLGLGVTPSTWSTGKAFELGVAGNALWGYSGNVILSQNTAGYSGGFIYATSAAATRYQQNAGSHAWYTAPSGTAGNAISFTQALTLNTNGALVLQDGNTSANGVGVTFPATQSASSDANTLDDYEEGTWTPTLRGSSTTGSYTTNISTDGATYTKIGHQVTVNCNINVTAVGSSGTGYAQITGLPFNNVGGWQGALYFQNVDLDANCKWCIVSFISLGTNIVYFDTIRDNQPSIDTDISGFTTGSYIRFTLTYFTST